MRSGHVWACLLMCGVVSPAMADYTTINSPFPGEDSQSQIMSQVYSGAFVAAGKNYTNGSLTAVRVEDNFNSSITPTPTSPLSITGNVGNDDQVWHADYISATVEAIFARYTQSFGYFPGASGGNFVDLLDPSGNGYNINSSIDLSSLSGDTLRWARNGVQGGLVTSTNADNADDKDHMVTYRIDGLPDESSGIDTWLIFFEDKLHSQGSDYDYNDLAIQIKGKPIPTVDVPEPVSLTSLAVFGMLGLARRRR